jgi:Flp pilus assembly protein CpaB
MGNLKKLLSNKNVVTLLGAILIVVVLFLFYRWRVNSATQPVELPYAMHSLEQGSQITTDDVAIVEVPQQKLKGNVITNVSSVYNKYASCFIPTGSLFFSTNKDGSAGNVTNDKTTTAAYLYKLGKDQVAFNYPVTITTTYGNSFFPDKYFDIYLRIKKDPESPKITFGRFINNVKILAVRDNAARDVFATSEELRQPSQMIFGLSKEQNAYLRVAEKLDDNVEIIIVPTAADLKNPDTDVPEPKIINAELKEYLEPFVENLDIESTTSTTPVESTTE